MKIEGGCYCGAVRYKAEGESSIKGQCHCRECQYISGGHPVVVVGMPAAKFRYTAGSPREFTRTDIENAVTRDFCPTCGTHLATRTPHLPDTVLLKVGTFDDPSLFGNPDVVIFTIDKQSFHHIPEGVPTFERVPG